MLAKKAVSKRQIDFYAKGKDWQSVLAGVVSLQRRDGLDCIAFYEDLLRWLKEEEQKKNEIQ